MTELMERAVSELRKLPAEDQNQLARELLDRLAADAKWDALLADPRSEALMDRLLAEAETEIAAGETTDCEPDDLRRNR